MLTTAFLQAHRSLNSDQGCTLAMGALSVDVKPTLMTRLKQYCGLAREPDILSILWSDLFLPTARVDHHHKEPESRDFKGPYSGRDSLLHRCTCGLFENVEGLVESFKIYQRSIVRLLLVKVRMSPA